MVITIMVMWLPCGGRGRGVGPGKVLVRAIKRVCILYIFIVFKISATHIHVSGERKYTTEQLPHTHTHNKYNILYAYTG